jgi:hypothetical protein
MQRGIREEEIKDSSQAIVLERRLNFLSILGSAVYYTFHCIKVKHMIL